MADRAPRPERFWSKRTDKQGPWDAIVIGSGMGGLTTAAILAKLGKRVLVLEQHYVPGGFTHAFRRKGYTWDVGVHAVGEVTTHSMPGRLLAWLTDGRLKWASLGPVYEQFYYPDGFRIDFPDSPEQLATNLKQAFPGEEEAIDRYLAYAREVARAMRGYYLARALPRGAARFGDVILAREAQQYLTQRTGDVLAELTDDPRLRAVFAAQWAYYGSPPSRSSFAIQALVAKHFMHGGYYPVGGSGEIARELLRTVAEAGGWTRIVADVDEVIIEKGRAVGVRMKDGEEIRAAQVISAAGVMSTMQRLMPPEHRDPTLVGQLAGLKPAPAHVCLYIGFKGDIRTAGASGANKWFVETWDPEAEVWDVTPESVPDPAPILYCSFPSLKDPEHDPGPEVRHTGEAVTFVPWEVFEPWRGTAWRKRGDDYEAFKQAMQDVILRQLLRHMPELEPMVDYVELSTPLSTDTFVRPMKGSIYGIEPTPQRFQADAIRGRSPVKGLYFAGSEVASVGVIGAMMGGVVAALAAEPIEAFKLMRSMQR